MRENMTTFLKTTLFLLLFVLNLGFFEKKVQAQNDPEQLAKTLVETQQYAEALPYFDDLVHLYPADKELNYYLGMCLAETKQFTPQAKAALQTSMGEDTPMKSLYYLGQCFHAENNFNEALNYYSQFNEQAKNRVKRTTEVDHLIELCKQQVNPFSKPVGPTEIEPKKVEEPTNSIAKEDPEEFIIPSELKDSLINFQINSNIKYLNIDQFKSKSSLAAYTQAWQAEKESNDILEKTNALREKYNSAFAGEKEEIANKILVLEKEAYNKNKEISESYANARRDEMNYWDQADPATIQAFSEKIRSMEDSIQQEKEKARIELLEAQKPVVLPNSFVKNSLPEQAVPVDQGVIYKIQLGAYSKTPPDWVERLFKKLAVIRRIDQYTDDNGVTVYTVGELKSYNDALQMQSQVRTEGVKDAFVAAYQNGKRISVKEARKITEE